VTNAELALLALDRINATGVPDPSLYADDFVFVTRGELLGRTEYHGYDGLLGVMREVGESWTAMRGESLSFEELVEDSLLFMIRWHVTSHSGVELDVDEAWVCRFRDGLFVRIEQFGDRDEALAAQR
jgi:ketosteroid isomerase-like protein